MVESFRKLTGYILLHNTDNYFQKVSISIRLLIIGAFLEAKK